MSGKLRAFFGLNDSGDVVVESHRKRRTDYMKKIQRLVVPDDENEEAAPENIVTAPAEEPAEPAEAMPEEAAPVSEEPVPETAEAVEAAEAPAEEEPPAEPEEPQPRAFGRRHGAEKTKKKKEKKSFTQRFFHMGESLRRPAENTGTLILVKTGALELEEDIEQALVNGQTILIDFEQVERKTAKLAITKLLNFIHMHNGAFYAVTRTSMLLSLRRDSVLEWRPGSDAGEQ